MLRNMDSLDTVSMLESRCGTLIYLVTDELCSLTGIGTDGKLRVEKLNRL